MQDSAHSIQQQKKDTARTIEVMIRVGLVIGLALWCFQILRPFISTIVWAMIIAAALLPAYNGFKGKLGLSHKLSATLFTAAMLAAILTPTVMLSGTLVGTAQEYAAELQDGSLEVPPAPERVKDIPLIGEGLYDTWHEANENLGALLDRFQVQIREAARTLLRTAAGAGLGLLQFAVAIIIAGVFLAYNEGANSFARKLGGRLAGLAGEKYAALASGTVRSVAQGVLGVAVIQALLAGIGLLAAEIPGAGLWTLLVLIMATVQLPTGIVLFPIVAYYASVADGFGVIVFGIYMVVVALSDNVLKPILLGRGSSQPMLVIFLGAIGGFILSGIVGLFLGAVVLALGYDLFILWLYADDPETLKEQLGDDILRNSAAPAGAEVSEHG